MPDDEATNGEEEIADPKDQETSDWTQVIELEGKSKMKPYSIETLATSKVPHNIPYLEVYRTDELYYQPYISPYLSSGVDGSTGSGDGTDSSSEDESGGVLWTELAKIVQQYYPASKDKNYWIRELRGANNNWTSVARVVNRMGGDKDKQNKVIRNVLDAKKKYPYDSNVGKMSKVANEIVSAPHAIKTKNANLEKELKSAIKPFYKSNAPLGNIVKRYMQCANARATISMVSAKYEKYLKNGNSSKLTDTVKSIKTKYS